METPEFNSVDDIVCYHRGKWFHPSHMQFFKTRLLQVVYQGPGGIYFVTSEQGPSGVRSYTVRQYDPETDKIYTQGVFNKLPRAAAIRNAKRYAGLSS